MAKPKSPTPPDPADAAKLQAGTNISTAQANSALTNINQNTPFGSLTYNQTGNQFIEDPNGQSYWRGPDGQIATSAPAGSQPTTTRKLIGRRTDERTGAVVPLYRDIQTPGTATGWSQVKGYNVPTYTSTQTLSPNEQAKYDATSGAEINLANLAKEQSSRLSGLLDRPVDLNNEATEARLWDLGRKRLDPMFAQREDQMRTDLVNRGLHMDSEIYDREMGRAGRDRNDAYNQLALQGRAQAIQEILTERNQPLNEIIGLLGGSQVNVPQFSGAGGTGGGGIAGVDAAGLQQQAFQNRFGKYSSDLNSYNQTMGGLMSAAGAIAAAAISDRRAKKDIKKIGTAKGMPLYEYRYKGQSGPKQVGLMAQDVEKKRPEAVGELADGTKFVDYRKALR